VARPLQNTATCGVREAMLLRITAVNMTASEDRMMKLGLCVIGCAGICAASGCVADSLDENVDQVEITEAETALNREDLSPNAIGAFRLIRLSNTDLCLQPLNGSTGDVEVELRPCRRNPFDPAQHWLLLQKSPSDWQFINAQSGKCLYNRAAVPLRNTARPITHQGCNIFGTSSPASNSLWKPTALTGFAQLMSRIQHRDSGFCLDVPNGNPFEGATMWNFQCNGTPAQTWSIGVD
jgi:hypothetical protein